MSITEDQRPVIEFLGAASTHGGASVERIETHISVVFLAGARAWKLKRAVHFDYIDASTVERRRALCEKEVALNRRTAPALYRGVVAVTRDAEGSLSLGGAGTPVEWLVEMERFDGDALLDRLARQHRLDIGVIDALAAGLAAFHRGAEVRRDHGGASGMRWVVDGNDAGFREFGPGLFDPDATARLVSGTRAAVDAAAPLLDARREGGYVRHCHGDLHLRNIVLHDGRPVLFDGIEFNDEIACVDVLYDLAFLVVDLWRRQLPAHASALWNRYLAATGDLRGVGVMPLFLSCRAAIRAKTSATALGVQRDPARTRDLQTSAREYLAMAGRMLHPPAPCLIAIGGLSGTGKSTVARALAPHLGAVPGAIVLRSDEVRKELFGVGADVRLGPDAYAAEVSARVYDTVFDRASLALRGGFAAIVDATFLQAAHRDAVTACARAAAAPCIGLWLEAPPDILRQRVAARTGDASDADLAVLAAQLARHPGPLSWHRVDAAASVDRAASAALALLAAHRNDPP